LTSEDAGGVERMMREGKWLAVAIAVEQRAIA